jgi:predicted HicB family RNase H-like nuclease
MPSSRRARADQRAQRINAAAALLAQGRDVAAAARQLASQYDLSERQARRYLEQARHGGQVEVPQARVVFTVKLPADLARRVRSTAHARGQSISALVTQALTEFLDRLRPRSGR